MKAWSALLQRWLRVDGALTLHRFAPLKLVAAPGESEQEFRLRCSQELRERRDAEKEKIRSRYDKRVTTLERRRLQRQQAVERESQVMQQRRLDAAVTVGSTILGAFLKRRAPSASSLGTAVRRTSSVGKAREALAQVEAEMAALQAELERELEALAGDGVHAEALELDEARKLLTPLLEDASFVERRPSVAYYLGRSHFGLGHFRDAIELFEEFAHKHPELADLTIATRL